MIPPLSHPCVSALKRAASFAFFCLLCLVAHSSARAQDVAQLPERDLAGGEIHTYKLTLSRGQFVRAVFDRLTGSAP